MVDRGEAELAGQAYAGTGTELVGVQPTGEPLRVAGGQDGPGLVGVERTGLAEDVDPLRVRRSRLEHRTGDEVDVAGRVVGVLRRHDVGAEEGGLVGVLLRDRQAARLVEGAESVAALDLDGRGALPAHLRDEAGHVGGELLVGGGTGRRDRRTDPAGGVALPRHPGGELGRAVAGEDEVGVGVDEAGDDRAAAEVAGRVRGRGIASDGRPSAIRWPSTTTAASSRIPWGVPSWAGSLVTSSAMPVSSSVVTRPRPRRWPRRRASPEWRRSLECGWCRGRR